VDEEGYRKTFREFEMKGKVTLNMGTVALDTTKEHPNEVVGLKLEEDSALLYEYIKATITDITTQSDCLVNYLSTLSPEKAGAFIMSHLLKGLLTEMESFAKYLTENNNK